MSLQKEIIAPIDKSIIKKELSSERFIRKTRKGDNEIYIVNQHNAPNVVLEIGRLREVTFRASGGGTGESIDLDEFDVNDICYDQLIVWSPEDEEIIGGYRFIKCVDTLSSNKDEMLKYHKESDEPTVIVSPSMDTGVSFDNDDARFQIIAKVPYPSLASQKNKLRQSNNPDWYSWKTVSGIIQMTGRPVRSNLDYADTIIIDGGFGDVIKHSSQFLPDWIQEAIKKINVNVKA